MITTLTSDQWTNLGNSFFTSYLRSYADAPIRVAVSVTVPLGDEYYVFPNETYLLDNKGVNVWVKGIKGNLIWLSDQDSMPLKPCSAVDLPSELYTRSDLTIPGVKRIRVDVAQSGFFAGRMGEISRKMTTPINFRFTCPVPFILHNQELVVSDGDIEMYAWHSSDVTASGTWTPVPVWRCNEFDTSYALQTTIASGGALVVDNANLYRDYIHVKTAGATAQRSTVSSSNTDKRYHKAGTYYIQFSGTGAGSYHLVWEERD